MPMIARIEPGSFGGRIAAPPSKSLTQRAFAAALLHRGTTVITRYGLSRDEQAALEIVCRLGARIISKDHNRLEISSNGVHPNTDTLHCGESGLAARLFTPIAAITDQAITLTGEGTLLRRPMEGFGEILPFLGVHVSGFNGCLPLTVRGPLQPSPVTVDGSGTSQFISGLLFAFCATAASATAIDITGLASKPYIDLTIEVLRHFGMPVTNNSYRQLIIYPELFSHPTDVQYTVEGDWSSAAPFLVAGAIAGEVTVTGLQPHSMQADKSVLNLLQACGADVSTSADSITVRNNRLKAFEFNAVDSPDLFPILSVLATCCKGESYISGIHRLFHKESNRALSISEMLQDFDVPFSIEDDTLCITGVNRLQGTVINSHADHRIAMAAAVGGLRASGPVDVEHAGVVGKSYPGFFDDFNLCGGRCTFNNS